MSLHQFVDARSPDGKPSVDAPFAHGGWRRLLSQVVHNGGLSDRCWNERSLQRPEDSVDKISSHWIVTISSC